MMKLFVFIFFSTIWNMCTCIQRNTLGRTSYDYIIVGGGTAGCVVATRLSENPNITVLLLEAGPDDTKDPFVSIPRGFYSVVKAYDWGFHTEPQSHIGKNKTLPLNQGKILGGSSSHNGMNIVRGSRYDFDRWAEMGNKGWGYDDVLPYFKKSEDMLDEKLAKNGFHGIGGPMQVRMNYRDPVIGDFIKAAEDVGMPEIDHNGPNLHGVALMQNNVNKRGRRHHPPEAYLRPVLATRSNLQVATEAFVSKVVIEKCKRPRRGGCKGKAIGVKVMKKSKEVFIKAKQEVIISAGALNTPRVLLLSGIGPKKDLERLDIPVMADLPVGEGLQDHNSIPLSISLPENSSFEFSKVNTFESLFEYVFSGTGPWSAYASQCTAFINTTSQPSEDKFPYLEISIVNNVGFIYNDIHKAILDGKPITNLMFQKLKLHEEIQLKRFSSIPVVLVHHHPRTTGKVELRSKNPLELPKITYDLFRDPTDIADLIEGIRFLKKWLNVASLLSKGLNPDIVKNSCSRKGIEYDTDDFWDCYIREHAESFTHYSSTCRMSPDVTGVVDDKLRVKGINNLRVIDASVMPNVVSGHLMASVIMIAEKGSDIIKESIKGN